MLSVSLYTNTTSNATIALNASLSTEQNTETGLIRTCVPPGDRGYLYLPNSTNLTVPAIPHKPKPVIAGFDRILEVRAGYVGLRAYAPGEGWANKDKFSSWPEDGIDPEGLLASMEEFQSHVIHIGIP